jgi:hypothetical protein
MKHRVFAFAAWTLAGGAACFLTFPTAAEVPVPPELNPGDTYHLAFVSSTTRDAYSSDITDYDAHVQAAADAAGIGVTEGVSWYAIGSTSSVDAKDHALVTAPVYRVDGVRIAAGYDDLWDGTIEASLSITEQGDVQETNVWVWTGTVSSGLAQNPLGAPVYDWVDWGRCLVSDTNWRWIYSGFKRPSELLPLYGLSEELTVPSGPGPRPELTNIVRTGVDEVTISFSSISGRHYRVWFAEIRAGSSWDTNETSDVTAAADTTDWPDNVSGVAARRYRVEQLP